MYTQFSTELHCIITFQHGSQFTKSIIHQRSLAKQGKKTMKLHLPLQWKSPSPLLFHILQYEMLLKLPRLKVKMLK